MLINEWQYELTIWIWLGIAAGTFLSAFLATKGSGVVSGINPKNLTMEIKKLKEPERNLYKLNFKIQI